MRRPKKRGNTRMDVAVDAMAELGFSPSVVRNSVKHLLKIYGGEECWLFIEQDAYKVLIEYILEDDNNGCDVDGDAPMAIMDAETSTAIGGDAPVAILATESSASCGDFPIVAVDSHSLEAEQEKKKGGEKKKKKKTVRIVGGFICDSDDDDDQSDNIIHLVPEPLESAMQKLIKGRFKSSK